MSDVVVYNDGELELNIPVEEDTIWLNQIQLSVLFDTSTDNIGLHLKNIYKEKELPENSTTKYSSVVQKEGNRNVKRNLKHYNLDAIISMGYRVNSIKATKFRQWATSVLKNYINNGFAINSEKITNDRFVLLENNFITLKSKVDTISNGLVDNTLEPKQQIFSNGSYYEAYTFISKIIKSAKDNIILIDNYIDDTTLTQLSKNQNVSISIYTHAISKQLKLDIEKYNKQYKTLKTNINKTFHDRYLIIDGDKVYSIGASLKDAGHKTFNINLMSDFCENDILKRTHKLNI